VYDGTTVTVMAVSAFVLVAIIGCRYMGSRGGPGVGCRLPFKILK
jgi:hypothetical protein